MQSLLSNVNFDSYKGSSVGMELYSPKNIKPRMNLNHNIYIVMERQFWLSIAQMIILKYCKVNYTKFTYWKIQSENQWSWVM